MGKTCHTGGTKVVVDYPPPGLICCPKVVSEKSVPGGLSVRKLSLIIPPQGTSIGQGWLERTPYIALVSRPYLDFLPPPPFLGGRAVGWPLHSQLCVTSANGPQATQPQGRLCTQGNVPSIRVSHYMRFHVLSPIECRPPLTICRGCDMVGRPCSTSFPCWSVAPLG